MDRYGSLFAGVLSIALVLVTACASGNAGTSGAATPGASNAQQVTVTVGNSMSFDPATISVQAGQPVQLTLRNIGSMPHDFSLSEGVRQPVKITAGGGQNASGTFTLDAPGTYAFDCSMPGHASAGMHGTITAQ
jgi:uncharacterized cupredoxin-like copper-binding protein